MTTGTTLRLSILSAMLAMATSGVHAQDASSSKSGYFTCKDAQGHVITQDRYIVECGDREQREYYGNGVLKRVIEAPLTPEQRRQREIDDKKKADAEILANERRRLDRVLLQSYSTAEGIDTARDRALAEPKSGIAKSQEHLADLKRERAALAADTEFYKNKPLPPDLETRLRDNEQARLYEEDLINRRNADILRINQRYDADKARFIQLTTDQKSPAR